MRLFLYYNFNIHKLVFLREILIYNFIRKDESNMKAHVDKDTCIACGLCPSICPECFDIEDDGKAGCIVDEIPAGFEDDAKEADESCPVNAIS